MTTVCLVTLGSAGDVHPMLALGQALALRGHRAVVLTNPAFEGMVRDAGLAFDAIGSAQDYAQTVAHPQLWQPVNGLGVMWRYLLRPALTPTFERLAAWSAQGPCVVLATPLAMGARVAQENLGLPLVSVYTAPTLLRSVRPPLTMAQWQLPGWMPAMGVQLAWHALDRFKLQPLVLPALESLRKAQGLAPVQGSVFGQWMHSPLAGVALFPAWFAPLQPDWPVQVEQTDFVRYDEPAAELPPGLRAFMAGGAPPVVFMPGTARHDVEAFFTEAVRTCKALGLRGVLLGRVGDDLKASLVRSGMPDKIWAGAYAPFAPLLPNARALVHHGGIGSSAQALFAGVPQLVMPAAYDQFDNALRLKRMGVSDVLNGGGLGLMQQRLQTLLQSLTVASACARWAGKGSARAARSQVCRLVERLA